MGLRRALPLGFGAVLAAGSALSQSQPIPLQPAATQPANQAAPRATPTPRATPPATPPNELSQARAQQPTRTRVESTGAPVRPPASAVGGTVPRTLAEALASTYSTHPGLLAERAKLRATDENVPQALAGWRPTVVLQGTVGGGDGTSRTYSTTASRVLKTNAGRPIATEQATVTQPLYTGGRTQANVNRARNQVMAGRAALIQQEQTSFTQTIAAYVGVIQSRQLLALNVNNEQVLTKQLQATNDRFRVGEITRTDVAQAEAALAGAQAQREVSQGQLATARGTFQQVVGFLPPDDLIEPQPLVPPVKNEAEARAMAASNNPQVLVALFNDGAARDTIDVAIANLMPQISFQGQTFQQNNSASPRTEAVGYQAVVQLSVPVYQGGAEYSVVRQAKQLQQQTSRQVEDARRIAEQAAVQAWATLSSARASAESTRAQIRANEIALEGVQREAIVGSRTTLDVLNAQQTLLSSRTNLVNALAQLVTASYSVAAAIGRLTARDMHLPVALYDETAYHEAVRNRWFGMGDYATDQPNR
jgi:outer membrane protein